ncbi:MAG: (Fe-S)-binding protein [Lachnospiraceae bacterium]|nr:(Fe-S)-binding protein [Lachnospiraceae bacterium]
MTENSKKHVDSCRFCWMCRHICPIGNATGLERNTARARALGLSLVNRGTFVLADVIDNVYECACCGACTKECVTGWDPVMFTKEARLDAAMEGVLPESIEKLIDSCLETGNAYGLTEVDASFKEAAAAHAAKKDILLFLGVDAIYKVPKASVNAMKVLEKAGVSFSVLEKEPPSGQQLEYLISAANETKEQMIACAASLNEFQKVVVFDPQDAKVFKREYKEWGVEIKAEVVTFTAYLAELLEKGALTAADSGLSVVYQDPFQLSRDLGETSEARSVISAFAACNEMLCHGKDTMWAGNLLMKEWMPDVILRVAADRIQNAKSVGADTIVTASVSEYASLKAVAQREVKILSLEELILGI